MHFLWKFSIKKSYEQIDIKNKHVWVCDLSLINRARGGEAMGAIASSEIEKMKILPPYVFWWENVYLCGRILVGKHASMHGRVVMRN